MSERESPKEKPKLRGSPKGKAQRRSRNWEEVRKEKPKGEVKIETISASSGHVLLEMVLEPDTSRCAIEKAEPRRRLTQDDMPSKTLDFKRRWIWEVRRSHVDLKRERVPVKTLKRERVLTSTLDYEGSRLGDPTFVRRTKHPLYHL